MRSTSAHLGRVLAAAGLSFQRTRTSKASPDPDYEAKAARVIALYKRAPDEGVVISFDQMGPISLRPHPGSGWAKPKRPERQRATFNRRHGTRYVFGAYDVHADRLRVRLKARRRGNDNLAFMRQIQLSYLNWDAFNYALARHICDRNGPQRNQRLLDLERRHQIAA